MGKIGQYPGIVRIVFDDQQRRIARLQHRPIVRHLLYRELLRKADRGEGRRGGRRRDRGPSHRGR